MTQLRLDIWDEAEDELLEAWERYNAERDDLGGQFLAQVDRTLDRIRESPLHYQKVRGELRRATVVKFPYSVIYRLRDDVVEILAIIHQARFPERWRHRRR